MLNLLGEILLYNKIDYYWDVTPNEQEYLVVGTLAIPCRFVFRMSEEQVYKIVEGIVNAKTKNELQKH